MTPRGLALATLIAVIPISASSGQATKAGDDAFAHPRVPVNCTLVATVQCGLFEQVLLVNPTGHAAAAGPDSQWSDISGSVWESLFVDDVTDTSDALPGAWSLTAGRPEVGRWTLKVLLPRDAPDSSAVMIDVGVVCRGPSPSGVVDDVILKPGQEVTWTLEVRPTADIGASRAIGPLPSRTRRP